MNDNIFSRLTEIQRDQLAVWPDAAARFRQLESVQTRQIEGSNITLQFNPARIVSTAAKVSAADIAQRPCFLCETNRPAQQATYDIGDGFDLMINPFPILSEHFCAVSQKHIPQAIRSCYRKLIQIASQLQPGYMVFYNGPRSGASAPDHLHLQIGTAHNVPLACYLAGLTTSGAPQVSTHSPLGFPVTVITGNNPEMLMDCVRRMPIVPGESEPRMNVIAVNNGTTVITAIIPRTKHRPNCYYMESNTRILVSPGAIDMCGLIITPAEKDFRNLTLEQVSTIYSQVTPTEPEIRVGITSGKQIRYRHNGETGFTISDVTIGIGFHWERREEQTFSGRLELLKEAGITHAINVLPVEDYLASVISSEMKPTANLEFLKAHAIISRSWVLAQMYPQNDPEAITPPVGQTDGRIIKWYDHDQHRLFHVCADDHCQRYQGTSKIISQAAIQAVHDTRGMVLLHDGHLCDARFSKCCGGITEKFSTCWQDADKPYLTPVADNAKGTPPPDLTLEKNAEEWIMSSPDAFCNITDKTILNESLNGFDLETKDFYRWKVTYGAQELSELFRRRSGIDVGTILDLEPVRRGPSGRIEDLRITGTLKTIIIGKELEIRRTLSESHLLSSAFVVHKEAGTGVNDSTFTLYGAGWGHGVGLCQIGAAAMGASGYTYQQILQHYYPGTVIGKAW